MDTLKCEILSLNSAQQKWLIFSKPKVTAFKMNLAGSFEMDNRLIKRTDFTKDIIPKLQKFIMIN